MQRAVPGSATALGEARRLVVLQDDVQGVQHTWEPDTDSQHNVDYALSTPSTGQKDGDGR